MTDKHESVRPHMWSPDLKWEDNFPQLEALWDEANGAVCALHSMAFTPIVDELAILMPGRDVLMAFVEEAVQHGWAYTRNSIDTVRAEPMGTVYGVQYHFLSHHDKPWRLEVMLKTHGVSPVHDVLWENATGFPVVHASYKPMFGGSLGHYLREQKILEEDEYMNAQECRSTYGDFSYWRKPGTPHAFYLKPRVNLRDSTRPNTLADYIAKGGPA